MTRRVASGLVAIGAAAAAAALLAVFLNFQAKQQTLQQARVQLERGISHYRQGALAHAEVELRQALRANPKEWKAPFYVGAIQILLKRFDMAIPYLERALVLNPTEPKISNALGVAYFNLGKLDLARGYFAASLDLDPTNPDAKGLLEAMAKLQWRAEQAAHSKTD